VLPREWVQVFLDAGVFEDQLQGKNGRGQATWVGTFLAARTGRTVTVSRDEGVMIATLRRNDVRGDQKRYFFEVARDGDGNPPPTQALPKAGKDEAATGGASPPGLAPFFFPRRRGAVRSNLNREP
jgi:hypothetical protein